MFLILVSEGSEHEIILCLHEEENLEQQVCKSPVAALKNITSQNLQQVSDLFAKR